MVLRYAKNKRILYSHNVYNRVQPPRHDQRRFNSWLSKFFQNVIMNVFRSELLGEGDSDGESSDENSESDDEDSDDVAQGLFC